MEYEIDCEKLKTELKGYKITTEELIELIKIYGKCKDWLKRSGRSTNNRQKHQ